LGALQMLVQHPALADDVGVKELTSSFFFHVKSTPFLAVIRGRGQQGMPTLEDGTNCAVTGKP